MKVILNQTVPKVGKEGQIVTVADGFARNFLFPRGLAILADKNQIVALERRRSKMAEQLADSLAGAQKQKEKLDGQTIRIEGKVGKDTGRLFGAITSQDVADALKAQLKFDIDKKKIALVQPLKRLGVHEVQLDLHHEVDAIIHVEVYDPDAPVAPVEEPAEAVEAEAAAEEVPVEA